MPSLETQIPFYSRGGLLWKDEIAIQGLIELLESCALHADKVEFAQSERDER